MRRITYWLSLALIFTIPFKEIFVLPGLGSVSRALGLVVAAFWLLLVVRSGAVRKPGIFHLVACLFFVWNFASVIWSISPDTSLERASTYLRMALLIWLIWDLYDSRVAIWRGCQAYVLGTWVTTGSLFLNYLNNVEAYHSANGRFAATGFNANETGLLLALALPLAWYLATVNPLRNAGIRRSDISVDAGDAAIGAGDEPGGSLLASLTNGLLQWTNFLYVPFSLFSILLTASRGSLIATAPLFLVIIFTIGKTSLLQRILLVVSLIAISTTFAAFIPEQNLERLLTTSDEVAASDLNGRVTVWQDGLDVFEENIVLGVGAGTFRSAVKTGKAPHNVFIALLVDVGLIGLTLFVLVLLVVFMATWLQPGVERLVWLAFLLTWLLGSMVGNWEYENVTWLYFCLIVRGATLYVQQSATDAIWTSTSASYPAGHPVERPAI